MSTQSPQSNNSWFFFFLNIYIYIYIMPLLYVADDKFKILDKRKKKKKKMIVNREKLCYT